MVRDALYNTKKEEYLHQKHDFKNNSFLEDETDSKDSDSLPIERFPKEEKRTKEMKKEKE